MALYKWVCLRCGHKTRALLTGRPLGCPPCPDCNLPGVKGEVWLEEPDTGGSTSVMETRDNGIMVRKIERFANVEELIHGHGLLTDPDKSGIV